MKRLILGILILSLFSFQAIMAETYQISVNQFVEHPALDAVLKGFKDYMKDNHIQVKFIVHNAQANMGTATQIGQQILGEKSDLIMAIATPSAQACARALEKAPSDLRRPFLFTAVTDPVAAGLVSNLKKPGGYTTGVSDLLPLEKHMKMLLTFNPNIERLGFMYNPGEANSKVLVETMRKLASRLGIKIIDGTATKTSEVYQAAKSLIGKVDAVFIPTDNTIVSGLESAIKVGVQYKIPIYAGDVDSVKRGAVAAMGFNYYKHGYQTGAMAKKILEGANPGDISVEFQKELELHINTKYAELMGVTPPQSLLKKADKIYDK
jgi:putative tryptophan/tyrosine transport system substrate-binding protein